MVFPIKKLRKLFPQMVRKKRADECVRKERHSHVFGVVDLFAQKNLRWEIRTKAGYDVHVHCTSWGSWGSTHL